MTTPFVKPGEAQTFTAPVGGVVSGEAYLIGSKLVIATHDADASAKFEGLCRGVVRVRKLGDEAWAEGDPLYFDATASPDPVFTTEVGSPALPLVGAAVENIDASPAVTTGKALLDGVVR